MRSCVHNPILEKALRECLVRIVAAEEESTATEEKAPFSPGVGTPLGSMESSLQKFLIAVDTEMIWSKHT
jgi:hypothetical protein